MKNKKKNTLTVVKQNQPSYPNAAAPGYYTEKILNLVTVVVSGMGFVSAMLFLAAMV